MRKFEFSKIILCLVMATYFVGLVFGMFIVFKVRTDTALCGLFSYIGAPVAVAIGFYSYKAKAENVEKIKKLPQSPYGDSSLTDGEKREKE